MNNSSFAGSQWAGAHRRQVTSLSQDWHVDKQPFSLTFTQIGSLKSPINLHAFWQRVKALTWERKHRRTQKYVCIYRQTPTRQHVHSQDPLWLCGPWTTMSTLLSFVFSLFAEQTIIKQTGNTPVFTPVDQGGSEGGWSGRAHGSFVK